MRVLSLLFLLAIVVRGSDGKDLYEVLGLKNSKGSKGKDTDTAVVILSTGHSLNGGGSCNWFHLMQGIMPSYTEIGQMLARNSSTPNASASASAPSASTSTSTPYRHIKVIATTHITSSSPMVFAMICQVLYRQGM
jgi:hypothetical protein